MHCFDPSSPSTRGLVTLGAAVAAETSLWPCLSLILKTDCSSPSYPPVFKKTVCSSGFVKDGVESLLTDANINEL